jgi:outer membrane protein OmpA-like peptidoglycan-associated protein
MYSRRMWQRTLLLAGLLCAAAPALAQVMVDLHALDALPGAKSPSTETHPHRAAPKPTPRPSSAAALNKASPQQPSGPSTPESAKATTPAPSAPQTATTAQPPTATPTTPSPTTPSPPAATLPTETPPTAALAPLAPPPTVEAAPPPPPPPISDTATSAASATGNGLRVTFGAGETDLSPASATAIQNVVKAAPPGDTTSFNVVAYAAGTPEDPSTARRLSLARALAVRSALMADGVSSARIYVRALGAQVGDAPADRVDLSVLGANAPPTPASAPAAAPTSPPSRQQ